MAGFDHGRFHVLGEGFMRGAIRVRPDPVLFPAAFSLSRGEETLRAPGRFTYDEGTRAADLVGTTYPPLTLVSDRVIEALAGFSGWTTYPVELSGREGEALPGYHGLAVTGRAGPIPRRGYLFEPASWDGSDVFMPGETALIMVVQEVRSALDAAGVQNLRLRRLTEPL